MLAILEGMMGMEATISRAQMIIFLKRNLAGRNAGFGNLSTGLGIFDDDIFSVC